MSQSILIVAAHPDDEVLGVGGAAARHTEEGDTVTILILGEGVSARTGVAEADVAAQQNELKEHATAAAKIVGAQTPILKQFPDNAFDTIALLAIIHEIETVINETKPSLVYTHHAGDVNVDHRITADAVLAAVRPMAAASTQEVRAFEIASSSEWNFNRSRFAPNVFVALTENQLKKKVDALRAYKNEIRTFPHPRSPEYLEALAKVRGGQSGQRAAESFELIYRRI